MKLRVLVYKTRLIRTLKDSFENVYILIIYIFTSNTKPVTIFAQEYLINLVNPLQPSVAFLCPQKTSENLKVFCFQGV